MNALRSVGGVCALVAALALASSAAAADDPLLAPAGTCGAAADQLGLDPATAQSTMQCLTNYARTQSGLAPLRLNATLNAAGDAKLAADVSCGEFSHTPCGRTFESVFADYLRGATQYRIGENIAWGTGSFGTPRETMNGWLHSSGHRENILSPGYTELGIGYLADQTFQGRSGATLWSQEFGTRTGPTVTDTTPQPTATQTPPVVVTKSRPKSRRLVARRHRTRFAHRALRR